MADPKVLSQLIKKMDLTEEDKKTVVDTLNSELKLAEPINHQFSTC